jgi:hypothetical protein
MRASLVQAGSKHDVRFAGPPSAETEAQLSSSSSHPLAQVNGSGAGGVGLKRRGHRFLAGLVFLRYWLLRDHTTMTSKPGTST